LGKPLPLRFVQSGENVLALRYSRQPRISYTALLQRQNPAFQIRVNDLETAYDFYQHERTRLPASIVFRIGAFFILFALHLGLYLYYRVQKANLYYAVFALTVLVEEIVQNSVVHEVKYIFYNLNIVLNLIQIGSFILLTTIYSLLNQIRGRIYWGLMFIILLGVALNIFTYGIGFSLSAFVFSSLISLEIVRVAFKGVKNKQRGAWIIAAGAIGYFLFLGAFLHSAFYGYMYTPISATYVIGDLFFNLYFLSIPIATSMYLGLNFAFTNRSLQQKLTEVKSLSQEKQQILAAQKEMLEQQVSQRTAQLQESLETLKATQAQLVQSEKMASLGELTAGIAHEIQNPLNFVNNFSDLNKEMIDELQTELKTGNTEEAIAISNDIKENEQKINHHGKRADAIVKGMLQHSRASTGKKEPTDINALADEYLRLSYHGLRAKDKDFNADFKTSFDETLDKIEVVPQDIGRVLLNLYNNAFYAVNEKKKAPTLKGENYERTVWVTTKRISTPSGAGGLEISVKDNGPGIPQKVVDKIFQPFFTTKPTGQGTGLGLSLSYDIIKAHGGELKVETKEGEGAEFIIQLPNR
jgi:signal transduction histidine kinase